MLASENKFGNIPLLSIFWNKKIYSKIFHKSFMKFRFHMFWGFALARGLSQLQSPCFGSFYPLALILIDTMHLETHPFSSRFSSFLE